MIFYDEIKHEIDALGDMIEGFGNCNVSHMEKIALAEQLADIVGMVRIKYQITSGYYASSEYNALKKYSKIHEAHTVERLASLNEMMHQEEFTATWNVDDYGNVRCSNCNGRAGYPNAFTNIPNPSAFCGRCGKRMTNV